MQASAQTGVKTAAVRSVARSVASVPRPLGYTLILGAIAAILAAAWLPFAPERLFDFDACNFALSLDYFQPALHQPQPPGYPLYVGLIRLIHTFVEDAEFVFLIAGILGAAAAVFLLWQLGERMFDRRTGIFAALLLMSNPILWQTGMSDQVRIYIAVISIAIALAVWPGWSRWEAPLSPRRFLFSLLLLGVIAGFRPEMVVSVAPLPFLVALRSRMKWRYYPLGAVALALGMAPWLIFLMARVGGLSSFVAIMSSYSAAQAGRSSLLFGAGWSGAWKMFTDGLWWASLGVASWVPVLLILRGKINVLHRAAAGYLVAWFVPLFLFSVIVHIAASGHALGFIPVLCLAGGWALSSVGETKPAAMYLCVMAALALNVFFFFHPYSKPVSEASYKTVEGISRVNEIALARVDAIAQQGPTFLVNDDSWVPWRILEYYYPHLSLFYIPMPMANPQPAPPVWLIRNRAVAAEFNAASEVQIPSCGTVIWFVAEAQAKAKLLAVDGAEDERYFVSTPARPGQHFQVGRYRLSTSSKDCGKAR